MLYFNPVCSSGFARSIYVKATSGSGNIQLLSHNSNTNNVFSIDENWQRVEINSVTSGVGSDNFYAFDMRGDSTDIYDIEIWGGQSEDNISYATSYIPTQGSTSTRIAETCINSGSAQDFNSEEGVLYAEIDYTPHSINYEMIASLKGTSTQQYIEFYFESNNRLGVGIYNGGAVQMSFTSAVQTKGIKKIAIAYKSNDFAIYLNGTQLHTDNSGSVPLLSSLGLGNNIALSNYQLSQPIKQFQLYNTRLSDEELQKLTTIQE